MEKVAYAYTTLKDLGFTMRPDADVAAMMNADLTVAKLPAKSPHYPVNYFALPERLVGCGVLANWVNSRAPVHNRRTDFDITGLLGDVRLPLSAEEYRKFRFKTGNPELSSVEELDLLHRALKITRIPYSELAETSVARWNEALGAKVAMSQDKYALIAKTIGTMAPFYYHQVVAQFRKDAILYDLLGHDYDVVPRERRKEVTSSMLALLTEREIRHKAIRKYGKSESIVDKGNRNVRLRNDIWPRWQWPEVHTDGRTLFDCSDSDGTKYHLDISPTSTHGRVIWDVNDFQIKPPPGVELPGIYPLLSWQVYPNGSRHWTGVQWAEELVDKHDLFSDRPVERAQFDPILGRVLGLDLTPDVKASMRKHRKLGENGRTNDLMGASVLIFAYAYSNRILSDTNSLCPKLEGLFSR